jgi:hypothetical protein
MLVAVANERSDRGELRVAARRLRASEAESVREAIIGI